MPLVANISTNNSYDRRLAIEVIETGYADMVAFGRPFINSPDLVKKAQLERAADRRTA